ncbi:MULTISPECIES: large-conductance mechanosensitive channel protein MscL [Eubacteriales]|uniref:large-conductance mechanosensitive channel protein MscL n=1 Tax=Eubacteriales TaxID=186802 RepID=UPI000B381ABF|nr:MULTISPECIES: large-conductance mechanosensitive channel protein MscL [Eubacteriales]OUN87514.1 large-conductance mechanosensitive channel [Gemmiger sp. An50]
MKQFLKEFKEFAMRGNVIDMAVGVVVGGAFSKIVTSLVNDVVMPLISLATGQVNFTVLSYVFRAGGNEVVLAYGNFIQTVVEFIILAFCVFCAVKLMTKLRIEKKKEDAAQTPATPPAPTSEELLTEIRDLLRAQAEQHASKN